MDELLTTKKVIELLKVDRTTIYRMLNDGRLVGVKVGNQWRFPRSKVQELISGQAAPNARGTSTRESTPPPVKTTEIIPLHCIKPIQDVFAEIAEIGVLTTDLAGTPLSEISNCSEFCRRIMSKKSGYERCLAAWQQIARQPGTEPELMTCHAGLKYARVHIQLNQKPVAMLIAGQFHDVAPDAELFTTHVEQIADQHQLDTTELKAFSSNIPVLGERKCLHLADWLKKVAQTFNHIAEERFQFIHRFQQIAKLTHT
ncbi:MAG: helix-turn-helix domain-containing protein [Gemmatimonadetes bacterium]|nr:MAG: helix-turn-helix domain-containing protein [Gemmatimonadota bacterium]